MKRLIRPLSLVAICAGILLGSTSTEVVETCPLCKTEFKARIDLSGSSFGMRLDLKKLGPISSPWRIPVCPKCKFVLYDKDIPKEDLAKCKAIVESQDYKQHGDRASYFLLGLLYEGMGREHLTTAHTFLKASWQEEGTEKYLKEALGRSLTHFDEYLKKGPPGKGGPQEDDASAYNTARLLKAEILRRLARFEEATKYLTSLMDKKEFQGNFLGDIVRYQIKLCAQKDANPHEVSEVERTGAPE